MPLQGSYGRKKSLRYGKGGTITQPFTREERIADLRESIRVDEILIHQIQDLLNPNSPCSFQIYLRELNAKIESLRDDRCRLIARYDAASNGEVPKLQQHIIKLQEKLSELKATINKTPKRIHKVKDLREKIIALERELRDATQTDIDELLRDL